MDHTDHEESEDDQNLGSDPVEPHDPPHWMSDPDGLSEPDRKIATMILGMLEGRADVHAAVSRALPAAPSGDGAHNDPAQPAAPATSEADFDPDAPIAPEDDEPSADAPTDPADAPAPDPEEASPEEIEGDTSGNEIAALADMLWAEPPDNPATSAEDAEGAEVGENDATNATEDADNMDGGDRSEEEPKRPVLQLLGKQPRRTQPHPQTKRHPKISRAIPSARRLQHWPTCFGPISAKHP